LREAWPSGGGAARGCGRAGPARRSTTWRAGRGVDRHGVPALNGTAKIAPATRQAIDEAVRELGYRPNGVARSLRTKSTQTIALLLPDITNPFFPRLVRGVQVAARRRGYLMLLASAEGDAAGEQDYLELFRANAVDGALVVGVSIPADRIAEVVAEGFPIVSLDRDIDCPDVPLVQVDNRAGARAAVEHLVGLGHRRIAHISGPSGLGISRERIAGYREALAAARLPADPALLVEGDYEEDGGAVAAARLVDSAADFTAIFAANDLTAIGAMGALHERGLRIPGDVSVVGFDDLRLASYVSPGLTTISQPAAEIGERAAGILIDIIRGRRRAGRVGHCGAGAPARRASVDRPGRATRLTAPRSGSTGGAGQAGGGKLPARPSWAGTVVPRTAPSQVPVSATVARSRPVECPLRCSA
jgi:DNA-binding LacI/PurR family transcriptional regulator